VAVVAQALVRDQTAVMVVAAVVAVRKARLELEVKVGVADY
jgi:hypothetical protein